MFVPIPKPDTAYSTKCVAAPHAGTYTVRPYPDSTRTAAQPPQDIRCKFSKPDKPTKGGLRPTDHITHAFKGTVMLYTVMQNEVVPPRASVIDPVLLRALPLYIQTFHIILLVTPAKRPCQRDRLKLQNAQVRFPANQDIFISSESPYLRQPSLFNGYRLALLS